MPAQSRPCVLSRSKGGFSLLTTSIVLAAAALIFVSVLPSGQDYSQKIIENNQKLERIDEAMRGFMASQGRRPCPADGQYAVGNQYFGVAAANPGSCQGGTPSAPLGPDSTGYLVGGTIPTRTLGLPDSYEFDAFGHRFTYIVDIRATKNNSCLTLTQGGITIVPTNGGTALDHTMYVYISHGRTGDGAWRMQGGVNRINTGNTDHDMEIDAAFGPAPYSWLTNGGDLVQKAMTNTFDDTVWYRPDLKNTCAIGALGPGGVGGGGGSTTCNTVPPLTGGDWGSEPTITVGSTMPPEVNAYVDGGDASCTPHILECNSGSPNYLTCDGSTTLTNCEYYSCVPTPPACTLSANQGGGSLPGASPGNTKTEYTDTSDLSCTANTITCTSGTLSCSTGNMSDCQYNGCNLACNYPSGWPSETPDYITSGSNITAYQAATVAYPSTCTSQTRTCTSGTLSGSYTNQACSVTGQPCTGTGALSWVSLNDTQTTTAYEFTTIASPGTCAGISGTITCNNGTLSNPSGYTNQSCSVTGGGGNADIWVVDEPNNRVEEFDGSGNYISQFGSFGPATNQMVAPFFLTLDSSGNIWVGDSDNNRVEEFNSSGSWLQSIPSGCPDSSTPACASGSGNGQFNYPLGVAIDKNGNVWVVDQTNDRVQEFSSSGAYLYKFGSAGVGNGQFDYPSGIAFDSSGNLWVTDTYANRVQEFAISIGNYLSQFGSAGSGNGQLNAPQGVAIDSGGNIWVADYANNRVQEFSSAGVYESQFGSAGSGNGQFAFPIGIAIDKSGNIWVTDFNNNRVEEFNGSTGAYMSQFGSAGSGNGQFNHPYDIAIDSSNNIWVTDYSNNRVEEFSSAGAYENQFGSTGSGNGQFDFPIGIAIDSSGNIWVTDGNERVQEFSSSGAYEKQFDFPIGNGNGQFNGSWGPTAITIDSIGNLWMLDSGNDRVQEFNSSTGAYMSQFGSGPGSGNGQLNTPRGIAVDSSGNIWVTDGSANDRLEQFGPSPTFLKAIGAGYNGVVGSIGSNGNSNGQFYYPYGIAFDSSGNVWVTDQDNNRVQEFNSSTGAYMSQFGSAGSGNGQFDYPQGIAFDSSGNIWVSDAANTRVQEFSSSGNYLSQFGTNGNGNGQFSAPRGIFVTATGTAPCTLPWGGTLNSGNTVNAYSTNSVNPPSTCPAADILTCTNGTLSCSDGNMADCQYASCTSSCTLPWGGYLASGNSATAYLSSSVVYPTTCSSEIRTCNNGTLSGSYTNQTCIETGQPCNLPWGGQISDGNNVTAYQTSTANAPATCTSQSRTCSNGTLSGSYTNQSCTQVCTLTANQGGGSLNTSSPGNTATEYTNPTGATCTANTLTCSPSGLSCSTGNISDCQYNTCASCTANVVWVADTNNHRIEEFDHNGNFLRTCGSQGNGNGQFDHPHGLHVDSNGNVWVADTDNHRIEEFDCDCNWKQTCGSQGNGNGQFESPDGIDVDPWGNIWVADTGNNRIQEFDHNCGWHHAYGSSGSGNGDFNGDSYIDIDPWGNIWVADTGNSLIQELDSSGNFVTQYGGYGASQGEFANPSGVDVDSSGNIWVADTGNNRLEEYTSSTWQLAYLYPDPSTNFFIADAFAAHTCMSINVPNCPAGTTNGDVVQPSGITFDSSGNIWVADTGNNRVQEFDSSGNWLLTIPSGCSNASPPACSASANDGDFDSPTGGIATYTPPPGNIWVVDEGNNRVEEFNSSGTYLSQFGSSGSGNGQFSQPTFATVDGSGNLWVTDYGNMRLEEFNSSTGAYENQFGCYRAGGQQFYPYGIAFDSSGDIWVADTNENYIVELNSSGNYLRQVGSSGSGNGQFESPVDIAIDSSGNIWVTDEGNNRVQEFSGSGTYESQFGSAGSGNGQFDIPHGIAIDTSGNIWVTDEVNDRVEEFSSSGTYERQFGSWGSGNGQFEGADSIAIDSSGNIWVTDQNNSRVEEFSSSGAYESQFGSAGSGNGQFKSLIGPIGIAIH